jgi:4'-phosphopantetheinyl transferase
MRQLLAKYLNCPPASLSYASGEFQKPFLAFEDLRFNLSHSNNLALLAVTRCSDIGVDVECCTAHPSALPIDQLSAPEQAFLRALPAEQVREAFFTIWTRKEALLKALGLGLHGDLSSFSALPGIGHAALHAADDRLTTLPHFESHNLIPARDYQAAVSVLNPNTTLRLFARIF